MSPPDALALRAPSVANAEPALPPTLRRRGWQGETYYGRPAVKPSPFGWMVAEYIWLGGLAGAAQLIATVADLTRGEAARGLVRDARIIGVAGSAVGSALLVADLHTPQRFYNMLRIFRRTSPMSIGTYILLAFAGSSTAALGFDLLGWRRAARAAQLPAALAGAGMTTYTAALLAATSTPLWAAEPDLLGVRFAASAMATGAAALAVAERRRGGTENVAPLDAVAATAAAVELGAAVVAERRYAAAGIDAPLRQLPWGPVERLGAMGLGAVVPLALHGAARFSGRKQLSLVASLAILAGGFLMRSAIMHAGNQSARRPRDYFRGSATMARRSVSP